MSWIISRMKKGEYEQYCDADIYGRGRFGGGTLLGLPELYQTKRDAQDHLRTIEKEEGWQYMVEYYE